MLTTCDLCHFIVEVKVGGRVFPVVVDSGSADLAVPLEGVNGLSKAAPKVISF